MFWLKFRRFAGNSGGAGHLARDQVTTWDVQEVCTWLENLQLGEYAEKFMSHDIRGRELLTLARRDLKELGITKVGHVKRILQAINDLNNWDVACINVKFPTHSRREEYNRVGK